MTKEKTYNANKISKFIYFFFTLQNKGIPVNSIYEKDGVKFIKTDRFQEIMGSQGVGAGGLGEEQKGSQESDYSFDSTDSYEYCDFDRAIMIQTRFKNRHRVKMPKLNFENLPEYETTEEDEEEGHQEENQQAQDLFQVGDVLEIRSPHATRGIAQNITPPHPNPGVSKKSHLQNAARKPIRKTIRKWTQ